MADALAMIESIAGAKPTSFVKWTAKKGAVVPLTHHLNEQVMDYRGCCRSVLARTKIHHESR
jgi:hypothetical protein